MKLLHPNRPKSIPPSDRRVTMFEFLAIDESTVIGGVLAVMVLGFLRFGNRIVEYLLSRQSSPIEEVEATIPDQN